MKISQKALACNLSPMRKFHPFAVAVTNNGKKIYHLNIGQPDIATPPAPITYSALSTALAIFALSASNPHGGVSTIIKSA